MYMHIYAIYIMSYTSYYVYIKMYHIRKHVVKLRTPDITPLT